MSVHSILANHSHQMGETCQVRLTGPHVLLWHVQHVQQHAP